MKQIRWQRIELLKCEDIQSSKIMNLIVMRYFSHCLLLRISITQCVIDEFVSFLKFWNFFIESYKLRDFIFYYMIKCVCVFEIFNCMLLDNCEFIEFKRFDKFVLKNSNSNEWFLKNYRCVLKKNEMFFYNVWNKKFAKRNNDLRIWNLTKMLFFEFDYFFFRKFSMLKITMIQRFRFWNNFNDKLSNKWMFNQLTKFYIEYVKKNKKMRCFFYNVWNKSFTKRNIDLRIWNLTKQLFFYDDYFEKKNITTTTSTINCSQI